MNDRIWKNNNAAFEKRYGFPVPEPEETVTRYHMGEALNGMPILYRVDEETGEEERLNSLYDPEYEAERWAQKFDLPNIRMLIAVQGFLDGYFARAAMKAMNRSDSFLVAYEADIGLFHFVCHHFDITDLLENPFFEIYLPGHHKDTLYKLMSDKIADVERAHLHMAVTPYYDVENAFYEDCNNLHMYLTADENTKEKLSRADVLNFLRSVKGLTTNTCLLGMREVFHDTGIPAVIVAAGPSLRKNVELLKEIQDKALIIAVDRAVPVLTEYGIKPHMTATVDAVKNPVFLESELVRDLPVLCYMMANRATQDAHEGHLVYFGVGGSFYGVPDIDRLMLPYGNVGGSVATAIFTCMYQIGIYDIILIGQDLAYDADLHTHADGSVFNPEWHNKEEVPGIDGGKVISRFDWMGFINFYEQEIIAHPELNVIDATEGGALIRGTKIMTFREAIDTCCNKTVDVEGLLRSLQPAIQGEQAQEVQERVMSFLPQLEETKRLADEARDYADQVRKAAQYGKDVFDEYYVNKMKEAEVRRTVIRMQPVYMLLENYAITRKEDTPGIELFVKTTEDALRIYRLLSNYFKALSDHVPLLRNEIRAVFDREAYLKEQEEKEKEKVEGNA